MRDWPQIEFTSAHQSVWDELNKQCGGWDWYSDATRARYRNGFHRLAHLVPHAFPDQITLARTLAESAISNRRSEVWDDVPFIVHKRFERAEQETNGVQKLVRDARRDWIAWEACRIYLESASELVRLENGTWEKRVRPIPDPVQKLMQDYFLDKVPKSIPNKRGRRKADSDSYHGAIILGVWMACESALSPTSRKGESGCQIVSDLHGLSVPTVNGIWSKRDSKPSRAPRN